MKNDHLHKYTELQPKKAGDVNYLYWLLILIFIVIIFGLPILDLIPDNRARSATTLAVFSITLLLLIHKHNEDYKKDMVNLSSILFKNYVEHRKIYLENLQPLKCEYGINLEKLYLKLFPQVKNGNYDTNINPLLSELITHTENFNNLSEISSALEKSINPNNEDHLYASILALKIMDAPQLELSMESFSSAIASIEKIVGTTESSHHNNEHICLQIFRNAHGIYAGNNTDFDSLEKLLLEVAKARAALGHIETKINNIVNAQYSGAPLSITLDDTGKLFKNLEYHNITPLIETILEELNSRMDGAADAIRSGKIPSQFA